MQDLEQQYSKFKRCIKPRNKNRTISGQGLRYFDSNHINEMTMSVKFEKNSLNSFEVITPQMFCINELNTFYFVYLTLVEVFFLNTH